MEEFPDFVYARNYKKIRVHGMRHCISLLIQKNEFPFSYYGENFEMNGCEREFERDRENFELIKRELEERGFTCVIGHSKDCGGTNCRYWTQKHSLTIDVPD